MMKLGFITAISTISLLWALLMPIKPSDGDSLAGFAGGGAQQSEKEEAISGNDSEGPSLPVTYHVDAFFGSNSNSGLSRAEAFLTIQHAINQTSNGDLVLVWPGRYVEDIAFGGRQITVRSAADAAVLEANEFNAVSFFNGEGADSVLEHFVITDSTTGIFMATSSPTLRYLTVVDNLSGMEGFTGSSPTISHCILWDNSLGDLSAGSVLLQATYSNIQEGGDGVGNISVDPLFVDQDNNDYHLLSESGRFLPLSRVSDPNQPADPNVPDPGLWVLDEVTSPCIDAGDPNIFPSMELSPNGGRINIGAYANTAFASRSPWPLSADLDQNGIVDFVDFASFARQWLERLPWANP